MAASNKGELLAITTKEFQKLQDVLSRVDETTALAKDEDDTSIKDIIAHRAHWIGLFFGWYRDGLAGKEVHFPAEGYKWNELKRFNAALREQHTSVKWSAAKRNLEKAHGELIEFIENATDDDLYSGPMVGANNHWPPGRWAEAVGPSHYRSAAKYVRGRLKG
jgi:hypothetical protein